MSTVERYIQTSIMYVCVFNSAVLTCLNVIWLFNDSYLDNLVVFLPIMYDSKV